MSKDTNNGGERKNNARQLLGRRGEQMAADALRERGYLAEVASYYLDMHAEGDRSWRIDVVAIDFNQDGKFREIRVYQHAVSEE